MPRGRVTCPLMWVAALGAAQLCGVSCTTGGIAPASLRYDCVTAVAPDAGPRCLAGGSPLRCVPARLSSVDPMAPGHVCHGPRCSLAGLGQVALEYRSCQWPGGSAWSPQCIRPWGCRPLCPVPLPPSVCVRVQFPGQLGAYLPVRTWLVVTGARALCGMCVQLMVLLGTPPPPPLLPPLFFSPFFCACSVFCLFFLLCFFLKQNFFSNRKKGRVHTAGTGMGNWCSGAVVLRSSS